MGRRFSDKLRSLTPAVVADVAKEMYAAGNLVQVAAQISITRGSASGRKTKKHLHVPSRPGEPPHNDTGHLANGIIVVQQSPLRVQIVSTADYSADLEFGTSRMAARPFMGPAADETRPAIERRLSTAVDRAIRRHMRN